MSGYSSAADLLRGKSVISFDVGFTLIEPHPSVGEVYARVARWMGFDLAPDPITERFQRIYRERMDLDKHAGRPTVFNSSEEEARAWWNAVCIETLAESIPTGHRELVAREIFDEFGRGRSWRLFEDVRETLETLEARGYRLVAISNWDGRLESTLRDLNLARFFEQVYISSILGHEKPSPEIFHRMLEECGVRPGEVVHVGDCAEDDVEGARAAGIQPVLILRREGAMPADGVPFVRSLRDLCALTPD